VVLTGFSWAKIAALKNNNNTTTKQKTRSAIYIALVCNLRPDF
jgi:hypothetical protein